MTDGGIETNIGIAEMSLDQVVKILDRQIANEYPIYIVSSFYNLAKREDSTLFNFFLP
jgi:hypothetical protein